MMTKAASGPIQAAKRIDLCPTKLFSNNGKRPITGPCGPKGRHEKDVVDRSFGGIKSDRLWDDTALCIDERCLDGARAPNAWRCLPREGRQNIGGPTIPGFS